MARSTRTLPCGPTAQKEHAELAPAERWRTGGPSNISYSWRINQATTHISRKDQDAQRQAAR
jgi:hypothetical protein